MTQKHLRWSYTDHVKLPLPGHELVALIVAVSFAAGINVYATVATLGIAGAHGRAGSCPNHCTCSRAGGLSAPASRCLRWSSSPTRFPPSICIWNALHTFIRVPARPCWPGAPLANSEPGRAACRHAAGRPDCAGRAWRQNRRPRCRHTIARAFLQHRPQPRRRCTGHLPYLAGNRAPYIGGGIAVALCPGGGPAHPLGLAGASIALSAAPNTQSHSSLSEIAATFKNRA